MAKLYTKRIWKNDVTKLSAKNLNHIEEGLETLANAVESINTGGLTPAETHTHGNKEVLDATTAAFTTELQIKYDRYTNKSTVSVSPTGTSEETVKYITVNGVEKKLAGQDEIQYSEVIGASLDELTTPGIYSVSNAIDIPSGTSPNGTLTVTKLNATTVEQEWKSKINSAQRLLTIGDTNLGNIFKVNNVTQPQGTIQLDAGGTYELQGNLVGHIIIGRNEAKDTLNNRTKIILNGVSIASDVAAAIDYTPKDKRLVVEIANNTENYIDVELDGEREDKDPGAINSENGLMITGVGYLTVKNTKGHGFKASEIYVDGNPHIYVAANHDAFHGKNLLKITGGYFYIADANDAFAAGHDDPTDDGRLFILGGEFDIAKTKEAAFESRSDTAPKKILNATIHFGEQVTTPIDSHSASVPIKVYEGLNTITGQAVTMTDPAIDFGPARVLQDGEPVPEIGGEYLLESGSSDTTEYRISGNLSGCKFVSSPAEGKKIDVIVGNVYYKDNNSADPFFLHNSTTKRIKFKTSEDTVCYIEKQLGNIIQSYRGIQITSKGDFILKGNGNAECGLYAPNSYVLLSGDGLKNISNCNVGIYADNIRLGEDPEDIADGKYSASDDPIYIMGSNIDAKITNNGDQTDFRGRIIATQYHTGITLLGSVARDNDAIVSINAQSGSVNQKSPGLPYDNSAVLYVQNAAAGITTTNVKTYLAPNGAKATIPNITNPEGVSPWTVYRGDGYTKEEVNTNFVPRTTYNALVAELDARTPKKINIINYIEDEEKGDHRPVKDHAYCPVQIDATTVNVVDSIEVFRYACPERIDIDDAPETHGDYIKDGRPIYARDGDFGYPEIDKTGQFNFRPVWNLPGYVLVPEGITPADGYNNFKTQWNIGIPGMYRITKVNKDLTLDLHAVKESEIPAHTIMYKITAPADYPVENLPQIRIFRSADHCEKFMKYGPGATNPAPHPELDTDLISGNLLVYGEPEVIDDTKVWTILDKAYDDANGLPSKDTSGDVAKVYFNIDDSTLAEGYACEVSAKKQNNNFNKVNNPTAAKKYYTLTKVAGDVEVTINVVLNLPDVTLTFVNNTDYIIENTAESNAAITAPLTINALKDFQFKVNHQLNDADKTHDAIITSVLINGIESTILKTNDLEGADAAVVWKAAKNKDECRIKKAYIPSNAEGTIVVTLGTASEPEPEPEPEVPGE